jgi:hypothetical protein
LQVGSPPGKAAAKIRIDGQLSSKIKTAAAIPAPSSEQPEVLALGAGI